MLKEDNIEQQIRKTKNGFFIASIYVYTDCSVFGEQDNTLTEVGPSRNQKKFFRATKLKVLPQLCTDPKLKLFREQYVQRFNEVSRHFEEKYHATNTSS